MAEHGRASLLVLCCGLSVAVPVAAVDELPDVELLDYLGSWAGSDEDWVLLQGRGSERAGSDNIQSDPESKDDESQEPKHER